MFLLVQIIILLWTINVTPVLMAFIFEKKWDTPLDGGVLFFDGNPIVGSHKTIRGLLGGILAGIFVGAILGISFWIALLTGVLSMLGDLLSSFIKRRFKSIEGTDYPVMDQIFEGAFPLIVIIPAYSLTIVQSLALILFFIVTAWIAAQFLTRVLRTPPFTGYSRRLRSKIRFREWRACDTIDYPFHPIINIERTLYYHWFMKTVFKLTGLYEKGKQNALDVQLNNINFNFEDLPSEFDNFTILFISDLHLDCLEGLTQKVKDLVEPLNPDICILGGDYRTNSWGSYSRALSNLKLLLAHIKPQQGIYAVLGNHDCLEMISDLKENGVKFLVNDSQYIEKNGNKIWLAGVDDPYYFEGQDLEETFNPIPDKSFTIFISHTPGIYREANSYSPQLYLCGHTHAGQVHLPYLGAVITHCKAPKEMVYGKWSYKKMHGYTSSGVGTSGVPVRFGCRGEVVLITLKKSPLRL